MAKQLKKQFAVFGLGRFGTSVTKALHESGADVLAVDKDMERVNDIDSYCMQSVCADATDERVLQKLGINNFDVAVICIGTNVESSIFITLMCKQLGVKYVVCKAQDYMHKTVLEKLGADRVIIPEEEMGERLAASLLKPNIIEIMSLSNFRIVEIITPEPWQNKSLIELDLRNTEKISVILVKRGDEIIVTPNAECVLLPDDVLVIAGSASDTERLSRKATKTVPEKL